MNRNRWLVCGVVVCLLAWGVRAAVVGAHRLHPDEALYGHYGLLIAGGRDPWLATVSVRKPPLLSYLLAGSLVLLGRLEWAVRLPGLVAGMATVVLAGRLARLLYRDALAGLTAMAVVALSPLALLFSATGRTDPLMAALGLAACVAAVEGRPGWAGLLVGLSFAAKQTALVWLPLVGLLAVASRVRRPGRKVEGRTEKGMVGQAWGGVGFLAVAGLVLAWDQVRTLQGAESFWKTGVEGYGGLRVIWPAEQVWRLRAWAGWLHHLLGSRLLESLLAGGAAMLVVRALGGRTRRLGRTRRSGRARRSAPTERSAPTWAGFFDLVLVGFCLLYLVVHWLWAFPVWSRYLVLLVPPVGVLLGRVVSALVDVVTAKAAGAGAPRRRRLRQWVRVAALAVVVACLAVPAARAVAGQVQAGAGWAAYDGVDHVASFLRQLPEGSVLYHHWLGWEYGFYLFDAPLYLAYWPTPAWLARDVRAFGETGPRYIVFPAWESSARVESALAEVGYRMEAVLEVVERGAVRFRVYRILWL